MAVIGSAYTSTQSVTNTGPVAGVGWWLKDPQDASRNMTLDLLPQTSTGIQGIGYRSVEDHAAFKALGRPTYVVVSDIVRKPNGQFTAEFTTEADYNKFRVLRDSGRILFLEGRIFSMNIRFTGPAEIMFADTTPVLYRVTIEYSEVDPYIPT